MTEPRSKAQRSIDRHLRVLGLTTVLLLGGVGSIAADTDISGAVIANGTLVVPTNEKKVQHPSGGVIKNLLVNDGDHVQAGQILIRLDDTVTRATLIAIERETWELKTRQARLEAERNGDKDIAFPADLIAAAADPNIGNIVDGEKKLFVFQREASQGQKTQLRERIAQLNEEIGGLSIQATAKGKEIDLLHKELASIEDLWQKNLVPLSRVTSIQRDDVRTSGEAGQLQSSIAQAKGKIAETELQIIQIDQDMRTDDSKQLADIRAKLSELHGKHVTALDTLRHIEIRAPQSGFVHELSVHTQGGVISAGEQLMLIVPDATQLLVEAHVAPQDIDQLHMGQSAMLRFPNFNQRTTPEVEGTVSRIAASTAHDDHGAAYYTVMLKMTPQADNEIDRSRLRPGMPVDAYVRTTNRTMLSYLTKPLADQIGRAFREK